MFKVPTLRNVAVRREVFHNGKFSDLETSVQFYAQRNTRHYAKRQITWLKSDNEINWGEYPGEFDTICNYVIEFFA